MDAAVGGRPLDEEQLLGRTAATADEHIEGVAHRTSNGREVDVAACVIERESDRSLAARPVCRLTLQRHSHGWQRRAPDTHT